MRSWMYASPAALLVAVAGCSSDSGSPLEPAALRTPTARRQESSTGPIGANEARYTFDDGRWISMDLDSHIVRLSTGEAITEVPDDQAIQLANLLGTTETIESYFEANPVPDPLLWCPADRDPAVGCRPYNEERAPITSVDEFPTRAPDSDLPQVGGPSGVLVRWRKPDGTYEIAPVAASQGLGVTRPGPVTADGTWGGDFGAAAPFGPVVSSLNAHLSICYSSLQALTTAYAHHQQMRAVNIGGLFQNIVDAVATAVVTRTPATWLNVGTAVVNAVGLSYAEQVVTRNQLAFLHVYATSQGCTVRSPSEITVYGLNRDTGVVGMGLPATAGGGSGGSSGFGKVVCTAMTAEISLDSGATWTFVQTTVCQMG